jgi:hypothetical protein
LLQALSKRFGKQNYFSMFKAKEFWAWFSENNAKYLFVHEIEPALQQKYLAELAEELHKFNRNLFFLVGGHPDEDMELVITAEGNKKYFEKVEELVATAPPVPRWKIIAFKPPMGCDFKIEYQGLVFDPREIWFMALENPAKPEDIGIQVCYKNYQQEKENEFLGGTFLILDIVLGEKSSALDLQHIEVGPLPENPEEDGFVKLEELEGFIKWKKNGPGIQPDDKL